MINQDCACVRRLLLNIHNLLSRMYLTEALCGVEYLSLSSVGTRMSVLIKRGYQRPICGPKMGCMRVIEQKSDLDLGKGEATVTDRHNTVNSSVVESHHSSHP